MSTSGFGQIPASNNTSPRANSRSDRGEVVKIIRLPDALQNNAKALRIEGTVTQINSNGSARIQTERGAVDVQLANNTANRPEVGQHLEVNIPAGKPPRQASIRTEPTTVNQGEQRTSPAPQTQNTSQTITREGVPTATTRGMQPPAPNTAQTSTPQVPAANSKVPNAPQVTLPPNLQGTTPPAPRAAPPAPLPVGSQVRLVAVPPSQANQIATQSQTVIQNPVTIQNTVIAKTVFTSTIIANNAVNALTQAALTFAPQSAPQTLTRSVSTSQQSLVNTQFNKSLAIPSQSLNSISITPQTSQALPLGSQSPAQGSFLNRPPLLSNGVNSGTINIVKTNALNTPINGFTATANLIPQGVNITSSQTGFSPSQTIGKIDVQVLQITPPNVTLTAPNTPPQNAIPALTQFAPPILSQNSAVTLTAQVTGLNAVGQPLVTLQLPGAPLPQSFVLQYTPNNIALGWRSMINIKNIGIISLANTAAQPSPALAGMLQGFQWGAFDDMVQTFIQQSPQAASSLIRSLPNAGNPAQLGAAGVMAMAAIRGGDLSNWLGDKKIEMLQRMTKGSLSGRLVQDSAAPRSEAASNADWRAVPLPMFWEGEIHKITLFMRQESQSQNQKNDKEGSTRFVFDLDMSRMGDVQIDGLLRDKRLDLVVRTQNGFSAPMQQIMRAAYANAIHMANMGGELSFQGNTDKWVHVIKENEQLGVSI